MSALPPVLDNDFRATTPRAPVEESQPAPERKFKDAVDSRRAERAHAASERDEVRDADDRVDERDEIVGHDESRGDDPLDEAEPDAPDSTQPDDAAKSRDPRAREDAADESAATGDGAASRRVPRSSKESRATAADDRRGKGSSSAAGIPWLAQTALESVLARGLSRGPLPGSSTVAAGSPAVSAPAGASSRGTATHVTPNTADLAEQQVAALKALTTLAVDSHPSAAPHLAREISSPNQAVDPRAALTALSAPQSSPVAAPDAPVIERLAPAELQSVFDRLSVRIDGGERSALVHLEPAELGPLRISLSLEPGGHVRAEMRAERPDGYAALEARLPELHKNLIERGFTSAAIDLSLGLADSNSHRSGEQSETSKSSSGTRRTLADAEVRAILHSTAGAIDVWA